MGKVDIVREVLRLGKGVNERAHPSCGAMFGPLQKSLFGCICQACLFCYQVGNLCYNVELVVVF